MRLTDLDPRWVTWARANLEGELPLQIGVSFLCPCCQKVRALAYFENPIHATPERLSRIKYLQGNPLTDPEQEFWHREGETFDALTLTPSIDGSEFGHWHGHITNGEAV